MLRRQAAAKATRSLERCLPLRAYRKNDQGRFFVEQAGRARGPSSPVVAPA